MTLRRPLSGPSALRRLCLLLAGALLGLLPPLPARAPAAEPMTVSAAPRERRETARPADPLTIPNPAFKGSLVIVGGGWLPEAVRDRFLELAGGKKARLVVIPTASARADQTRTYRGYAYWQRQGAASVSLLNTLDPHQANDPMFIKPLTEATGAWLGGGDQTRLTSAYHNTAVERELRKLLERGGVIGGTSAGASAMSAIMIAGGNQQAEIGTGFGFLPDVVVDQHFQNRRRLNRLLGVLTKYPRCLGLGIDEGTAVVIHGHKLTVLGDADVRVCLPPAGQEPASVKVLKSGQEADLVALSKAVLGRIKPPAESRPTAPMRRATP